MTNKMNFERTTLMLLLFLGSTQARECGQPEVQPETRRRNTRIVGGRNAVPNSWPWQASLKVTRGHVCGGTLIDEQWILTAAHCLTSVQSLNVSLGAHSLKAGDENLLEISSASEGIKIHPDFNKRTLANDIAMVKLKQTIPESKWIKIICLPEEGDKLAVGEQVYVTGWGHTGGSPSSRVLKQVMVPVISHEQCSKKSPTLVPPQSICTGYPSSGYGPCHRDSGGPLVRRSGESWYVHGIVSFGPKLCGVTSEPAVYVRVTSYLQWIHKTMSEM